MASPVPAEPVTIGFAPQLFVDDFIVDNRWALRSVSFSCPIWAAICIV